MANSPAALGTNALNLAKIGTKTRSSSASIPSLDSAIDLKGKDGTRRIEYKELETHNTETNAWIAIRGKVYDVTRFLKFHPGGKEALLYGAGRDATLVFESYHPLSVKQRLSSLYIGELHGEQPLPTFSEPSAFFQAVKQRVQTYFHETYQDPKYPPFLFYRYFTLFGTLGFFWYLQVISNFWLSSIFAMLLGVCCAHVGLHPLHDATHFTVTSLPIFWKWVAASHDFLNGASHSMWIYQHVLGHHPYTNIPNADPDVASEFRRLYTTHPWSKWYQYQHIWLPLLYGTLAWKTRLQDISILISGYNGAIRLNPLTKDQLFIFWGGKLFFLFYRVWLPLMYFQVPWTQFWVCFGLSDLVTSYYLAFAFQSNHLVQQATIQEWHPEHTKQDWAKLQVRTTLDYACTNPWVTYFTGSLNFQVVHHLFPGVHQFYYPRIWNLVKQVCHEYNIEYLYVNQFNQALKSHLGHLKDMGKPTIRTKQKND